MRDYDSVWTLREVGAHRLLFSRTLTILALANCRNEKFADFLITLKGNIQQTANVNCSLIEAIIVNTMKTLKIIVVLMWILRWNFQNLISINAHNALHTVCVIQRNSRFEVECLCVCVCLCTLNALEIISTINFNIPFLANFIFCKRVQSRMPKIVLAGCSHKPKHSTTG